MACRAKKTEHSGAKKVCGTYWGRKVAAKDDSNRKRLENYKASVAWDSGEEEIDKPGIIFNCQGILDN